MVKRLALNEEVNELLIKMQEQFVEYYGREMGEQDFVAAFAPIYNDKMLLSAVRAFRHAGFPEEKIYAYYKSDGLFPCNWNIDSMSETELDEFTALSQKYRFLMNEKSEGGINILQFVAVGNQLVEEHVEYAVKALISTLNNFIHRHSEMNTIQVYKIRTEFISCLEFIKCDETHTNVLYGLLLDRLEEEAFVLEAK